MKVKRDNGYKIVRTYSVAMLFSCLPYSSFSAHVIQRLLPHSIDKQDMDYTDGDGSALHKPFRLLDLPAELFLAILSNIVVQPTPIYLHPTTTGHNNIIITKPDHTIKASTPNKEPTW